MPSLYPALLGPAWGDLAPPVQRLHAGAGSARGVFSVRRGAGVLARLAGWILGVPPAGEGVPVTLAVEVVPFGERWRRAFGGSLFSTVQWRRGALLVEAVGLAQTVFRLRAERGALVFEQVGARLGLRRFSLPLPRWITPRIEGRAEPLGDEVHVDVRVHAPALGLLVAYEGRVAASPLPEALP